MYRLRELWRRRRSVEATGCAEGIGIRRLHCRVSHGGITLLALVLGLAAVSCTNNADVPTSAPTRVTTTEPPVPLTAGAATVESLPGDAPDPRRGRIPAMSSMAERDEALAAMVVHAYEVGDELSYLFPSAPVAWNPGGAPGYLTDVVPLEGGRRAADGRIQSYRALYEPHLQTERAYLALFDNEVSLFPDRDGASTYVNEAVAALEAMAEDEGFGVTERTEIPGGLRILMESGGFFVGFAAYSFDELASTIVIGGQSADHVEETIDRAAEISAAKVKGVLAGELAYGPLPDLVDVVDSAEWTYVESLSGGVLTLDGFYRAGVGFHCIGKDTSSQVSLTSSVDGRVRVSYLPDAVTSAGAVSGAESCGRYWPNSPPHFFSTVEYRGATGFLRHLPDLGSVLASSSTLGVFDSVRYDLKDLYQRYLGLDSGVDVHRFDLWLEADFGWPVGFEVELTGDGEVLSQYGMVPGSDSGTVVLGVSFQVLRIDDDSIEIPAVTGVLAEPPAGTRVAYSAAGPDGTLDIYIMDPKGRISLLAYHPNADEMPAISPDGGTVVYKSHRAGNNSLFLVDVDGGNPRRLTAPFTDGGDVWPMWSPDGTTIVFASDRPESDEGFSVGINDLWTINVDGFEPTRIYGTDADEIAPAWSPVDDVLVFLSDSASETDYDVYTVRLDGTGLRRLTNDGSEASYQRPVWSPDGLQVLVSQVFDGAPTLRLVQVDGSGTVSVDTGGVSATSGWFTPDGQHIVFTDGANLWSVRLDGSELRPLTSSHRSMGDGGPSIAAGSRSQDK